MPFRKIIIVFLLFSPHTSFYFRFEMIDQTFKGVLSLQMDLAIFQKKKREGKMRERDMLRVKF